MKICITSDLHGYLPKIDSCELLLICGDIVPVEFQNYYEDSKKWFIKKFTPWINNLPCIKVLFIPGNHELCIEGNESKFKELFPKSSKATILFNEYYEYISNDSKSYEIFGTPYCKLFGHWAYIRDDETLKEKYSEIPQDLDILITHDAPYGCTDICLEGYNKEHLGNLPLRDVIVKKSPKFVFHGHLHSSKHEFEELYDSKVINCSIMNERYRPLFNPIYLEI